MKKMLEKLPDDILFHVSTFLDVIDTLNMEINSFVVEYSQSTKIIQKWYRKHKKLRDTRYTVLLNEFSKRNERLYKAYYANIFFTLYNQRRVRKLLKEYHFYAVLKYYFQNDIDTKIFEDYDYTLKNLTYTTIKSFLKKLPVRLILRL